MSQPVRLRKSLSAALAFAVLLSMTALPLPLLAAGPDAAAVTGTAVVAGTVTSGFGVPTKYINVDLLYELTPGDWSVWASTSSNSAGQYAFSGIPAGDYRLRFSYSAGGMYVEQYYDDKDEATADVVTASDGATVTADAQLPSGAIAGTVKNAAGDPVPGGVFVDLYMVGASSTRVEAGDVTGARLPDGLAWVGQTRADPTTAVYAFPFLISPFEQYKMHFWDPSGTYAAEWWQDEITSGAGELVEVSNGITTTVDPVLGTGGAISGTVSPPDAPGQDAGDATANGAPTGVANVYVYRWNPGTGTWEIAGQTVSSDIDGTYSIAGLAAGDYRVLFIPLEKGAYAYEFYPDSASISGASDVTVTDGTIQGSVDAVLDPSASVSGLVRNDVTGDPIASVPVVCAPRDDPIMPPILFPSRDAGTVIDEPLLRDYSMWLWPTYTAPDGTYAYLGLRQDTAYATLFAAGSVVADAAVQALEPSLATVVPSIQADEAPGPIGLWAPEAYDDLPTSTLVQDLWTASSFTATSPVMTSVDASLTKPGDIYGTVEGQGVGPLPGIEMRLYYDAGAAGWRKTQWNETADVVTQEPAVSGAGFYGFSGLKAGDYKVYAWDPAGAWRGQWSDPVSVYESSHEVTFTLRPVVDPNEVEGPQRYATSVAASEEAFDPGEAGGVVVTTGEHWADGLVSSSLAGALNGPLLLTQRDRLPTEVASEIGRLGVSDVVVVGGTDVVSRAVFDEIDSIAGVTARRIAGATRFETGAKVAGEVKSLVGGAWTGDAICVTGEHFPDGMTAAPLAAGAVWPVLLTRQGDLPPETVGTITSLGIDHVALLGGETATSEDVFDALEVLVGVGNVDRIGGGNRYTTASLFGEYAVANGLAWDGLGVASGVNFPDAISGGVMQGLLGSPIVLTDPLALSGATASTLQAHKAEINSMNYLGGVSAFTQAVRDEIEAILNS